MIRDEKKLKKIATQIIELENLCQKGDNVPEKMNKMAQLISSLNEEEIYAIDDYIIKKKILTD